MPRITPAQEAATTAARLVYSESDLSEGGEELRERWAEDAEFVEEDQLAEFWALDYKSVLGAFRRQDGAPAHFNQWLLSEEEEPLKDEEAWKDYFKCSEDWSLEYVGSLKLHEIRVWSFNPFDGNMAYAVARSEEEVRAEPTSVA